MYLLLSTYMSSWSTDAFSLDDVLSSMFLLFVFDVAKQYFFFLIQSIKTEIELILVKLKQSQVCEIKKKTILLYTAWYYSFGFKLFVDVKKVFLKYI